MSYDYQKEREKLFTDDGQRQLLEIRDRVQGLLKTAGAFRLSEAVKDSSGSSWLHIACIDRLVELGEIVELKRDTGCWAQFRIFTTSQTNNY
jgi:hypothetical protein